MTTGTKLLIAAWGMTVLASALFILSFIAALLISVFAEVPAVLTALNALWMPWGVLAVMLMIVLRLAGRSLLRRQASHG